MDRGDGQSHFLAFGVRSSVRVDARTAAPLLLAGPRPSLNELEEFEESRCAVAENVVYRYDPAYQPAYQYFSIPHSCIGGGDTLAEARASYRSGLAVALDVSEHGLPAVVEHLQTLVAGMWLRTGLGGEHTERMADGRMFVEMLLRRGRATEGFRTYLDSATTEGFRSYLEAASEAPCVVIVESEDTLGFVIDQMTADDAVWMVFANKDNTVGWVGIYGPDVDGAEAVPHSIDGRQLRHLPIGVFVKTHVTGTIRQLRLLSHPTESDTD
jgi:hypothetical protein